MSNSRLSIEYIERKFLETTRKLGRWPDGYDLAEHCPRVYSSIFRHHQIPVSTFISGMMERFPLQAVINGDVELPKSPKTAEVRNEGGRNYSQPVFSPGMMPRDAEKDVSQNEGAEPIKTKKPGPRKKWTHEKRRDAYIWLMGETGRWPGRPIYEGHFPGAYYALRDEGIPFKEFVSGIRREGITPENAKELVKEPPVPPKHKPGNISPKARPGKVNKRVREIPEPDSYEESRIESVGDHNDLSNAVGDELENDERIVGSRYSHGNGDGAEPGYTERREERLRRNAFWSLGRITDSYLWLMRELNGWPNRGEYKFSYPGALETLEERYGLSFQEFVNAVEAGGASLEILNMLDIQTPKTMPRLIEISERLAPPRIKYVRYMSTPEQTVGFYVYRILHPREPADGTTGN